MSMVYALGLQGFSSIVRPSQWPMTDPSTGEWKDYLYLGMAPIARVDHTTTWSTIGNFLKGDKSTGQIHLDWSTYSGTDTFGIYRTTNDFTFASPALQQETTLKSYDDSVLTDGNNYAYRIRKKAIQDALYFYHNDHLMTPLAVTDDTGATVWQGVYYPFGLLDKPSNGRYCIFDFPPEPPKDKCDKCEIKKKYDMYKNAPRVYDYIDKTGNTNAEPTGPAIGGVEWRFNYMPDQIREPWMPWGGAWYVPQGDPCINYCICMHEWTHEEQGYPWARAHRAKAEKEAYKVELICLESYF